MRAVRFSCAMSLDGYIAAPDGGYDWIVMDPEIDFTELFAKYDAMLMGRKSYDAAKGGDYAPDVTVSNDPKETIKELKAAPGKDIWLWGGGELFRSLLELKLVDELEIALIPVLLGDGLPLLPTTKTRVSLVLKKEKHLKKTGTVMLNYDVAYSGRSRR